ncbi:HlyD family secretion protein [Massilia genomosp. 1]|uniref:HlyD family efflux transporter periplasmic adaptor subunit n=1 Tax=Massilia genomosp. 1 TaxID=2609280 RepID=A0ABX0N6D5_9BURK|nr:HlyD family efflux transporter periplasmic adaptor subunit [Massilia genomosp. 1]NHZ67054.1 HlyD family efflux transporter periplasmic adaptor subunit [Massilia genomosp. 1]
MLTAFLMIVMVVIVTFLLTARYARKETVSGQITPSAGSFKIVSQLNGIAERVLVSEGQHVKVGQELIAISANPVLESGDTLVASLKSIQAIQRRAQEMNANARAQQLAMQIEEFTARRDGLSVDLARQGISRKILEERRLLQAKNVSANQKLLDAGMLSAAASRQHDDAYLAVQHEIAQAERETELQRSQLAQVSAQIGRLHAEANLARSEATNLKAQLDEREVSLEAQHTGRLISPIDGIVTALQPRPGTSVTPGQTLAVIIPATAAASDSQLEVELWAPSRSVGFVHPGAKVRIMYDAFPYQTFGMGQGVVREVSGTPLLPGELPVPGAGNEQLFRIRVSLSQPTIAAYGRDWRLVSGMRLSADLILEEQTLFEWLLEPLRAMKKRAI